MPIRARSNKEEIAFLVSLLPLCGVCSEPAAARRENLSSVTSQSGSTNFGRHTRVPLWLKIAVGQPLQGTDERLDHSDHEVPLNVVKIVVGTMVETHDRRGTCCLGDYTAQCQLVVIGALE